MLIKLFTAAQGALIKAYSAFFSMAFFAGLANLDLPNEPLKIFPFLVFLSPLPMLLIF
jgi:hypothetical protein